MKPIKTDSRRGFDSHHLHQKHLCSKCINTLNKIMDAYDSAQNAFDGGDQVIDWVRSIEVDSSAKQKPLGLGYLGRRSKKVNANDSQFALAA